MTLVLESIGAIITALAGMGVGRVVIGAVENQTMKYGECIGYDDLDAYLRVDDEMKRRKYWKKVVHYFKENKVKHGVFFIIKAPLDAAILKVVIDNHLIQKLFNLLRQIGSYVSEILKRNISQIKKLAEHIWDNLGTYWDKIKELIKQYPRELVELGISVPIATICRDTIWNGLKGVWKFVYKVIAAIFGWFCECAKGFCKWLTWEAHKYYFFVMGSLACLYELISKALKLQNHEPLLNQLQ
eukprot:311309_1